MTSRSIHEGHYETDEEQAERLERERIEADRAKQDEFSRTFLRDLAPKPVTPARGPSLVLTTSAVEEHADRISRQWLTKVLLHGRRDGYEALVDWLQAEPCGLAYPDGEAHNGTWAMNEPHIIVEHYRRHHGPVPRAISEDIRETWDRYMPREPGY